MNHVSAKWRWPQSLFFCALFLGLLGVGRSAMLRDPGTFWHTVAGQRMLDTGEVLRTDPFSFSRNGQPWLAQQWLGECTMAMIHGIGRMDSLLLAAAALLAFVFTVVFGRLVRGGLPPAPAGLLVLLVIAASSYHFLVRPHLATIAFMCAVFCILLDVESRSATPRRLWWLPVVMVVWTNIHGGALGGLATILLTMLGWVVWTGVARRVQPTNSRLAPMWQLGSVACACACAVLVNPFGAALPAQWLALMASPVLPTMIVEHAPLDFFSIEAAMILAVAGVYGFTLSRALRQEQRFTWFIPLIWLVLALSRVRHGPLFAITAALAIADMLPFTGLSRVLGNRRGNSGPLAPGSPVQVFHPALVSAVLVVFALSLQIAGIRAPVIGAGWARLDPAYWPVATAAALQHEINDQAGRPRVFNEMRYGGYLIYHVPDAAIYIDDRCELYGDAGLRRYRDVLAKPELFAGLADYEDIDLAMIRRGSRLDRRLGTDPNWRAIASDAVASLYQRTPEKYAIP